MSDHDHEDFDPFDDLCPRCGDFYTDCSILCPACQHDFDTLEETWCACERHAIGIKQLWLEGRDTFGASCPQCGLPWDRDSSFRTLEATEAELEILSPRR